MAMFGKNENLIFELAKAQAKCELLEKEVERMHAQVDKLQEALVAATSPKAYDQMQYDKENSSVNIAEESKKFARSKEEERIISKYLEDIEKPTFTDADDLIASLGRVIGVNVGSEPLSSNNEG